MVNEAGVTMANTVGRHAYRLVRIELDDHVSVAVLCNDALIVEEFSAHINFLFEKKNYLTLPAEVELPGILEWVYVTDQT